MKKWVTKISMILVVMAMCIVGFGSVPVYASMEDEAIGGNISWGKMEL